MRSVGIFIFDGVEVLDFAGPFEVFAAARVGVEPGPQWRDAPKPFNVFTVASASRETESTGGLRIVPQFTFDDCPAIDILVIPGGAGVRPIIEAPAHDAREWVRRIAARARLVTSVCTGAWVLARTGLLAKRRATTHYLCFDRLAELDPTIVIERGSRVVDDGVITAAGVSAGIDMALYVLQSLHGARAAQATAQYIEYAWSHARP